MRRKKFQEDTKEESTEEKEEQKFKCCLCGNISYGYGHDPYPLRNSGKCCDKCNQLVVLRRLSNISNPNED